MFPVSLTVHYPSDMDGLTRWSRRLSAAYHTAALTSLAALVAWIWLAVVGHCWWLVTSLIALWLVSCLAGLAVQRLVSEVDMRRCALLNPQHIYGA